MSAMTGRKRSIGVDDAERLPRSIIESCPIRWLGASLIQANNPIAILAVVTSVVKLRRKVCGVTAVSRPAEVACRWKIRRNVP